MTDLIQPILDELERLERAGSPISQAELSRLSDVSPSTVSEIVNGKLGAHLVNIEKIYGALGLGVKRLRKPVQNKSPKSDTCT